MQLPTEQLRSSIGDGEKSIENEWFERNTDPRMRHFIQIAHGDSKLKRAKERAMKPIWDKKLQLAFIVIAFILGMATGVHAQVTCQTIGSSTLCSDGSSSQSVGSTTFYQPPTSYSNSYRPPVTCQTVGNMTYCN